MSNEKDNELRKEICDALDFIGIYFAGYNAGYNKADIEKAINDVTKSIDAVFSFLVSLTIDWGYLFRHCSLSEDLLRGIIGKKQIGYLNFGYISACQVLSEKFIEDFEEFVDWDDIVKYQNISESFLMKNISRVLYRDAAKYQKISETAKCAIQAESGISQYCVQTKSNKTDEQKLQEIKEYAASWGLKFDGEWLYAFRSHNKNGSGVWNNTTRYTEIGKEYRDWHCDESSTIENSYGLGIWPERHDDTNVRVKVHYKDWGCEPYYGEGKGRVWAFTLLGPM